MVISRRPAFRISFVMCFLRVDEKSLLGELQFCFVCFLVGHGMSGQNKELKITGGGDSVEGERERGREGGRGGREGGEGGRGEREKGGGEEKGGKGKV